MSTPGHSPDDRIVKTRSGKKGGRSLNPHSDFGSTENNSKLMSCLNIVNNQLNTRRTYKEESSVAANLHDQFASLSKAYDSSQNKILQLEESLMQETLVTEKQRSIIEILKQLLEDSMDDETVLSFLGELSKDTPNSSELCQTILSIRNLLEKQKLGTYLKNSKLGRLEEGLRTMEQRYELLKTEFIKMEEQNRGYSKEAERLSQKQFAARSNFERETQRLKDNYDRQSELRRAENAEMGERLRELERELDRYHSEIGKKQAEVSGLEEKLRRQEERNHEEAIKLSDRLTRQQDMTNDLELRLKKLELSEQSLRGKYIEEMNEKERLINVLNSLQEVLGSQSNCHPDIGSGRASSAMAFSCSLPNQVKGLIEKKDAMIEKYKRRCSKMLNSHQLSQSMAPQQADRTDVLKTEVFILKKFLTQEAVKLVGEYEQNPKEYLEKEIVEMAKLEAQKRSHLQHCEEEVWKLRSRLLQYEQRSLRASSPPAASQQSKTRLPSQPKHVSCSQFQV